MSVLAVLSILLIITLIMIIMMMKTSKNQTINSSQAMNFECGFNSKSSSMVPYSAQFFTLAILFLVFDLEISIFIPSIMTENFNFTSVMITMVIMISLFLIFILEWGMNMIKWSK